MAEQKKCTVSFNIVSPFITGNGDAPFALLDATLPRDDNGHIYFTKSLLRGVFRDAVTSLMNLIAGLLSLAILCLQSRFLSCKNETLIWYSQELLVMK